jgi:hypothetical protein
MKQAILFAISGWIGTALFMGVYEYIHGMGEKTRPLSGVGLIDAVEWSTLAWTSSYLLSILWQHSLHRHLVFGTSSPYLSSLVWTYVSYSISIVLSSIFSYIFVSLLGVHHRIAFGLTLAITGVINYFTLKGAFEGPAVEQNYTGKVAVITGAGSGSGRALAQLCASKGYSLALADINEKGLKETEQSLRFGGDVASSSGGAAADRAVSGGEGVVRRAGAGGGEEVRLGGASEEATAHAISNANSRR